MSSPTSSALSVPSSQTSLSPYQEEASSSQSTESVQLESTSLDFLSSNIRKHPKYEFLNHKIFKDLTALEDLLSEIREKAGDLCGEAEGTISADSDFLLFGRPLKTLFFTEEPTEDFSELHFHLYFFTLETKKEKFNTLAPIQQLEEWLKEKYGSSSEEIAIEGDSLVLTLPVEVSGKKQRLKLSFTYAPSQESVQPPALPISSEYVYSPAKIQLPVTVNEATSIQLLLLLSEGYSFEEEKGLTLMRNSLSKLSPGELIQLLEEQCSTANLAYTVLLQIFFLDLYHCAGSAGHSGKVLQSLFSAIAKSKVFQKQELAPELTQIQHLICKKNVSDHTLLALLQVLALLSLEHKEGTVSADQLSGNTENWGLRAPITEDTSLFILFTFKTELESVVNALRQQNNFKGLSSELKQLLKSWTQGDSQVELPQPLLLGQFLRLHLERSELYAPKEVFEERLIRSLCYKNIKPWKELAQKFSHSFLSLFRQNLHQLAPKNQAELFLFCEKENSLQPHLDEMAKYLSLAALEELFKLQVERLKTPGLQNWVKEGRGKACLEALLKDPKVGPDFIERHRESLQRLNLFNILTKEDSLCKLYREQIQSFFSEQFLTATKEFKKTLNLTGAKKALEALARLADIISVAKDLDENAKQSIKSLITRLNSGYTQEFYRILSGEQSNKLSPLIKQYLTEKGSKQEVKKFIFSCELNYRHKHKAFFTGLVSGIFTNTQEIFKEFPEDLSLEQKERWSKLLPNLQSPARKVISALLDREAWKKRDWSKLSSEGAKTPKALIGKLSRDETQKWAAEALKALEGNHSKLKPHREKIAEALFYLMADYEYYDINPWKYLLTYASAELRPQIIETALQKGKLSPEDNNFFYDFFVKNHLFEDVKKFHEKSIYPNQKTRASLIYELINQPESKGCQELIDLLFSDLFNKDGQPKTVILRFFSDKLGLSRFFQRLSYEQKKQWHLACAKLATKDPSMRLSLENSKELEKEPKIKNDIEFWNELLEATSDSQDKLFKQDFLSLVIDYYEKGHQIFSLENTPDMTEQRVNAWSKILFITPSREILDTLLLPQKYTALTNDLMKLNDAAFKLQLLGFFNRGILGIERDESTEERILNLQEKANILIQAQFSEKNTLNFLSIENIDIFLQLMDIFFIIEKKEFIDYIIPESLNFIILNPDKPIYRKKLLKRLEKKIVNIQDPSIQEILEKDLTEDCPKELSGFKKIIYNIYHNILLNSFITKYKEQFRGNEEKISFLRNHINIKAICAMEDVKLVEDLLSFFFDSSNTDNYFYVIQLATVFASVKKENLDYTKRLENKIHSLTTEKNIPLDLTNQIQQYLSPEYLKILGLGNEVIKYNTTLMTKFFSGLILQRHTEDLNVFEENTKALIDALGSPPNILLNDSSLLALLSETLLVKSESIESKSYLLEILLKQLSTNIPTSEYQKRIIYEIDELISNLDFSISEKILTFIINNLNKNQSFTKLEKSIFTTFLIGFFLGKKIQVNKKQLESHLEVFTKNLDLSPILDFEKPNHLITIIDIFFLIEREDFFHFITEASLAFVKSRRDCIELSKEIVELIKSKKIIDLLIKETKSIYPIINLLVIANFHNSESLTMGTTIGEFLDENLIKAQSVDRGFRVSDDIRSTILVDFIIDYHNMENIETATISDEQFFEVISILVPSSLKIRSLGSSSTIQSK